jgi:hypothetical protein
MKMDFGRIRKALYAGAGALVAELAAVLLAGGDLGAPGVMGAAAGLAVMTGMATYRVRNRLAPDELRTQLAEAVARARSA